MCVSEVEADLLCLCPVQGTLLASCWISARSRWSSIWTDISCHPKNRFSPRPRKCSGALPAPVVQVLGRCSVASCSSRRCAFFTSAPGSLQPPALCRTSSVSLTLGPNLSATHLLSSSAPSTTLRRCSPVRRSSSPGELRRCGTSSGPLYAVLTFPLRVSQTSTPGLIEAGQHQRQLLHSVLWRHGGHRAAAVWTRVRVPSVRVCCNVTATSWAQQTASSSCFQLKTKRVAALTAFFQWTEVKMSLCLSSVVCVWSVPYSWRRAPCAGRTSKHVSDSSHTSPDTLFARGTVPTDSPTLQTPPPALSPPRAAEPRGGAAKMPELWSGCLERGGDSVEMENGKRRWEERRGSQLESSFYLHLLFGYFWELAAEAGPRIFNFLSTVCFPEKSGRPEGQELSNQITAKTIIYSHSIVSFQWYEHLYAPSQSIGFFYLIQSPSCTSAGTTAGSRNKRLVEHY